MSKTVQICEKCNLPDHAHYRVITSVSSSTSGVMGLQTTTAILICPDCVFKAKVEAPIPSGDDP